MTPKGHHTSILRKLYTCARHADIENLNRYLASQEFLQHLIGAGPKLRDSINQACTAARERCERLYRISHPQPTLLREKDGQVKWTAPGMIDILRQAYAKGNDDEGAARILGISKGAAQLARRRHLDVAATAA